jgi:DNA-binding MarR family transcriptional regulator
MKLYRTNDTVNSKEQEVLDIINQYPGLNSSKIAKLIGKSTSTTKRYLNSLVRLVEGVNAAKASSQKLITKTRKKYQTSIETIVFGDKAEKVV